MLHLGLQEEMDSFYPDEEHPLQPANSNSNTRMMDRALAMLVYDEYVPMPMCRTAEECPTWSQISVSLRDAMKTSSAPQSDLTFKSMLASQEAEVEKRQCSVFTMSDFLSAMAHTGMEDHMLDERDLSGWDVSMSPYLIPDSSSQSPPRQNLFLNDKQMGLYLSPEKAYSSIKFVHEGHVESRYPPASAFIRSTTPIPESNNSKGLDATGWSSLDEVGQQSGIDMDESEWIIA